MEAKPVSDKFNYRSLLTVLVLIAATVFLLNMAATVPVSASGPGTSVIIEFKDDPAAVYKAKTEKAGGKVSDDQLQAYRDQLRIKQDQFLNELNSRGISYQVDGVDIPDFTGAIAGHADFRYTLVLDGITLTVPSAAVDLIKTMPQVKSVQ